MQYLLRPCASDASPHAVSYLIRNLGCVCHFHHQIQRALSPDGASWGPVRTLVLGYFLLQSTTLRYTTPVVYSSAPPLCVYCLPPVPLACPRLLLLQAGNLCHVDCSGRGQCDYQTGECSCYDGFYGENCGKTTTMAFDPLLVLVEELL